MNEMAQRKMKAKLGQEKYDELCRKTSAMQLSNSRDFSGSFVENNYSLGLSLSNSGFKSQHKSKTIS